MAALVKERGDSSETSLPLDYKALPGSKKYTVSTSRGGSSPSTQRPEMAYSYSGMVRLTQGGARGLQRSVSMETYMVRVYPGSLCERTEFVSIEALKNTQADAIVQGAVEKLRLGCPSQYELAEGFCSGGQLCKERRLQATENPVKIQLLWPKIAVQQAEIHRTEYRFFLRKKESDYRSGSWIEYQEPNPVDHFLSAFLKPRDHKEYPDLCNLPDLNENTLLENLKSRFANGNIYTYVGSILISVNPFKFYPIYNPKYVNMYQNRRLGELPPHIFAIADAAFHTMLQDKSDQCIVISGESGSGKTESTNLLLHHLSALSQRGVPGSGIEQTILGAGPVLEAFGNAKTVHNNNSSRFGKFIQVNYKENGMVHGALVEKYLLEKSRIVSQAENERNYHVFYYLLAGASDPEKESLWLTKPEEYVYLNQSKCYTLEGVDGEFIDEAHEFTRLKQSMEMVGFSSDTQRRLFCVLAAVLHLGNVEFKRKPDHTHHDAVSIKNQGIIKIISGLLKVKESTLVEALTKKKTVAGGETVVMSYNMADAIATRDAVAKCLYGALFDWIVLQVNHALLAKREIKEHQGNSIGVLDIFGFEDFSRNSFEQFCINYANEHLHYYFNQHIFKFEQEEYLREGIQWKNIEFIDNTGCLDLFANKPTGLLCLLDEECNFPGASNETLLAKFHARHSSNTYYEMPQLRESVFSIVHYAGKVKYHIQDFREKNSDHMRQDIVLVLKNSSLAFVRELVGIDPVAVLRWAIIRAFFRAYFAFREAGKRHRKSSVGSNKYGSGVWRQSQHRMSTTTSGDPMRNLFSVTLAFSVLRRIQKNKSFKPKAKPAKGLRDLKSMKTVAGQTLISTTRGSKNKNKAPSVSAQFSSSLFKLMDTLDQANPFFIRCIKSNSDKAPCKFDEELVLRQLRYTGMLATVKIRQSGYNYRLSFEEFIQHYKILLPKGLVSSKEDVRVFLTSLDLNQDNYQIGKTKVFLREAEKILLDNALHLAIMKRIIYIQYWVKTKLERRKFLRMRTASIVLQKHIRCFLAQRRLYHLRVQFLATILIQRAFRGFRERKRARRISKAALQIQTAYRGYQARKHYKLLLEERDKERRRLEEERQKEKERQEEEEKERERNRLVQEGVDLHSSTSDEGILTKESSTEELEIERDFESVHTHDSEESSGILDDSESEVGPLESLGQKSRGSSFTTPPSTPSSPHPQGSDESGIHLHKPRDLDKAVVAPASSPLPLHSQPGPRDLEDEMVVPKSIGQIGRDRFIEIDEVLSKNKERHLGMDTGPVSPGSSAATHRSPFHRAKKHIKNFMGGGKKMKKDSGEESDDSQAEETTTPTYTKYGVQVLPSKQTSNKGSPKKVKEAWGSPDIIESLPVKTKHRRKNSKKKRDEDQKSGSGKWNVAGTSQWKYPTDRVVNDAYELQQLDQYVFSKIVQLSKDCGRRDTVFDIVFKGALKEFHASLIQHTSLAMQGNPMEFRYKDLMTNFESMLTIHAAAHTGESFPVPMGINAFRGFLDEFNKKKESNQLPEIKGKKDKKKKEKDRENVIEHMGHQFQTIQFTIPTYCEYCNCLMWMMEKGQTCQICSFTCHKKCVAKSKSGCRGMHGYSVDHEEGTERKVIGAPLPTLLREGQKVPVVVERLIKAIELHGLYTVGIYRKTGAAAKVRQLIKSINTDVNSVDFNDYHVHVLTSVMKTFFREMPEPLLSCQLYDEFIRVSECKDDKERLQSLYSVIDKLPKQNHMLLERLIFHLARVALHEPYNKMSANGLAIIFAPSILRTNRKLPAQASLDHVPKQTLCVEEIIKEQMKKIRTTLADIKTLDSATASATDRLSMIRASIRCSKGETTEGETIEMPMLGDETDTVRAQAVREEQILSEQIQSLQREKEALTIQLPTLECRNSSSEEDLLSTDEIESTGDEVDEDVYEEYAVTFDLPGTTSDL